MHNLKLPSMPTRFFPTHEQKHKSAGAGAYSYPFKSHKKTPSKPPEVFYIKNH